VLVVGLHDALHELGVALLMGNSPREAISALDHAAALRPDDPAYVADAGFAGYALFMRLLLARHSFLIRVGRNITLLKDLGYYHEERDGLVYLCGEAARRRPQWAARRFVLETVRPWADRAFAEDAAILERVESGSQLALKIDARARAGRIQISLRRQPAA